MSEPKSRGTTSGKAETELSKLKDAWQRLSEAAQGYWLEQFSSRRTQADLRKEIFSKLKINLTADSQLTRFRAWLERQIALDQEAEAMHDDEERLKKQYGDSWSLDQIRDEVLRLSFTRAIATGDFAAGRKTIVQLLNTKKVALDEKRYDETKKDDQTRALELCLEEAKEFPEVQELFKTAFAALKKAKAAKK